MATVHFRLGRGDQPTQPCWVNIHDPQGKNLVPLGRNIQPSSQPLHDVGGHWITGEGVWTAECGSFEIPMGDGIHQIRVHHGFGVPAWEKSLDIGARHLSCRLKLDPLIQPPPHWVPGDLRVHGISPRVALSEAQASGVRVVQIQSGCHWPRPELPVRWSEALEFSGFHPALESPSAVVAVNTLNRHPLAGSVSLLHAHRPIHPWGWGWEEAFEDWALADWCAQCHRIRGVVVWPELEEASEEFEAIAALILGDIDAVELCGSLGRSVHGPSNRIHLIYELANHGIFPSVVGASGKDSNLVRVGQKGTWVDLGEPSPGFSPNGQGLDLWMRSLKQGQCLASVGPWFSPPQRRQSRDKTEVETWEIDCLTGQKAFLEAVGRIGAEIGVWGRWALSPASEMVRIVGEIPVSSLDWIAFRLVDDQNRLLAHGKAMAISPAGERVGMGPQLQNRLGAGMAAVETGKVGFFSPRIRDYLHKAWQRLES